MASLIADSPARAGAGRGSLVFIGFMGAGKSTAARILAERLHLKAIDSDALLEERFGRSVAEEFLSGGEERFRAAEEEVICALLERAGPDDVVALGGGSILSAKVREALERHLVVLLDIDVGEAWERVRGASAGAPDRPLSRDRDTFTSLYEERRALYEGLACAVLPGNPRESLPLAVEALQTLRQAPARTRLLWASAASGSYPVFAGRHLLRSGFWPVAMTARFCVTDETVGALYGSDLGSLEGMIAIPPGESHKTLASAEGVWRALARSHLTRADQLVALGGGVVGDLAGFCAATYQRGVAVVQVPSTLVAQVDSAYGGKTGVDLPEAKNYVGAYHQPAGVLLDPSLLESLSRDELNAGWVEVLKTALIAGGELWETVAAGEAVDESIIIGCVRTKLGVVRADERDSARRQVLNLGHTVGHAIETVTGYTRLRHGEAVGLGLLAALRLSGQRELHKQVYELLQARELPVTISGVQVQEVIGAIARDKKRVGATVPFVLVDAPGDVRVGCEVSESELQGAVRELIAND